MFAVDGAVAGRDSGIALTLPLYHRARFGAVSSATATASSSSSSTSTSATSSEGEGDDEDMHTNSTDLEAGEGDSSSGTGIGTRASTRASTRPSSSTLHDPMVVAASPTTQVGELRRHFEEMLVRNFHGFIMCFSIALCLLVPTMLLIQGWLLMEFMMYRKVRCDVPLQDWTLMVFAIMFFNATVNRPTRTGSVGQRLFCRWSRDPLNPQPMPCRVRLYNCLVMLVVSAWNVLGLYWVSISGSKSHVEKGDPKPCSSAAPGLFHAVEVYALFNLALMAFMYIQTMGLAHMLHLAMSRGLFNPTEAAPEGALEANTEAVDEDDPLLAGNPSCPVCLDDLSVGASVVTKSCGHVFHEDCLQGWFQYNRTCPLCREDIGNVP